MNKHFIVIGTAVLLLVVGLSGCTDTSERIGAEYDNFTFQQTIDNTTDVSYEDLMRYMENYIGEIVRFRGEVSQVFEETSFLMYIKDSEGSRTWDRIYYSDYSGVRLLEDDNVDVWGCVLGYYEFKTVLGATEKVPSIRILHLLI